MTHVVGKPLASMSLPEVLATAANCYTQIFDVRLQICLLPSMSYTFCSVTSLCESCQRNSIQYLRRLGKHEGPVSAVWGPKFMKFWEIVGDPSQLSMPISCLSTFFSEGIRHKVSKSSINDQMYAIFTPIFGRDGPSFYCSFSAIYLLPLGEV